MTKQVIIEKTLETINQLPDEKAQEILDFADFVFKRYEKNELTKGLQTMSADSQSFNFLNEEAEIYTITDLKKVYNA